MRSYSLESGTLIQGLRAGSDSLNNDELTAEIKLRLHLNRIVHFHLAIRRVFFRLIIFLRLVP